MMKMNPKMMKLSKEEIDSILEWLRVGKSCPSPNEGFQCKLCRKVLNHAEWKGTKYCSHPCYIFDDANRLPDLALDLLEYNGFEIPGDPEDYPRLDEV